MHKQFSINAIFVSVALMLSGYTGSKLLQTVFSPSQPSIDTFTYAYCNVTNFKTYYTDTAPQGGPEALSYVLPALVSNLKIKHL